MTADLEKRTNYDTDTLVESPTLM